MAFERWAVSRTDQAEKDTVISNLAGMMEKSPYIYLEEFQEKETRQFTASQTET